MYVGSKLRERTTGGVNKSRGLAERGQEEEEENEQH